MGQSQDSGQLKETDIIEISKATKYSREQVKELYSTFSTKYPQGYVDHKGFKEMYKSMFSNSGGVDDAAAEDYTNHMFRAYDVNGDGKVSFMEFVTVLHLFSDGTPEEVLGCMFRLYDINGDGSLSQQEVVQILTTIYRLRLKTEAESRAQKDADMIMGRLDRNHNKRLSEQEFISAAKSCPEVLKVLKATK